MSYWITRRYGAQERDADPETFGALLDELADVDDEHPDVSISHESGWTLSAHPDGSVVWENVEKGAVGPRHRVGVSRADTLQLFRALAAGDLATVEAQSWSPGYG